MKSINLNISLFSMLCLLVFIQCKKDNNNVEVPPTPQDSPELLTSMILQFKDSANTTNSYQAEFRDPDGPGGKNASRFDTIRLKTNSTYFLNIILLDETKTPIDTISKEVWNKRNEHQLFFNYSNINIISLYLDKDDNGLPLGLNSKWRCGSASTGSSKITLKHQPNIKNGNINSGETDIELNFQTILK